MAQVESGGAPVGSRYCDQRPYVIADRLEDLQGPTGGIIDLDSRLDWSTHARFDLDNPRRLASMYETVLREATTQTDLTRWLNRETLLRLWPNLVLPARVRALWQARFPQLARPRDAAA